MILVTGATGFVGRHIVADFASHGHAVRALVRPGSPGRQAIAPHVQEWAEGDVLERTALLRAAQGCAAVIHLVAVRRQWRERTFDRLTAESAELAVAAAQAAGVQHFILMSALGLTDAPVARYMQAKARAEAAVRQSGLPYTILRPSFVVGAGGFVEEYAGLIRQAPVVPVPGTGRYPVQPVAAGDVAAACRRAVELGPQQRVYDLAGPDRVSFYEFIGKIMEALGSHKPRLRVPLALMRPMAAVLQRLTPNPPATTDELLMLEAGNYGDPAPAVRDLGLSLTPLATALHAAVTALREGRRL